tara:strand:- start:24 stop:248 length:225 start_codon:yes stop_codon:yes gene_type:complete
MSDDKLGTYITKLMTTVLDKNQEDFVKELAMSELQRLEINISDFVKKHLGIKETEQTKKQLLQEEKDAKQSSTR